VETNRPEITGEMDSTTFLGYYYLKEELVLFCRKNGLPVSGSKTEITERIVKFLDTGSVPRPTSTKARRRAKTIPDLTKSGTIEADLVCSEKHRAFFRKEIGAGFSFNTAFQRWLKSNAGKTYGDAITAYREIMAEKKKQKQPIDRQFEYNTYIRDFFAGNPGMTLKDAVRCWNYKKSMKGSRKYEPEDLSALTRQTSGSGKETQDGC